MHSIWTEGQKQGQEDKAIFGIYPRLLLGYAAGAVLFTAIPTEPHQLYVTKQTCGHFSCETSDLSIGYGFTGVCSPSVQDYHTETPIWFHSCLHFYSEAQGTVHYKIYIYIYISIQQMNAQLSEEPTSKNKDQLMQKRKRERNVRPKERRERKELRKNNYNIWEIGILNKSDLEGLKARTAQTTMWEKVTEFYNDIVNLLTLEVWTRTRGGLAQCLMGKCTVYFSILPSVGMDFFFFWVAWHYITH